MRAWRALLPRRGLPDGRIPRPEVFVVDRGPSAEKVVAGLVDELFAEPWRDPRDYVLIDARGDIKEKFAATTWSIEEELGASVFAVVDGALRNLNVSVFYSDPVRVKRVEKTVMDNLQLVADDDDNTLSFLSGALARDQQFLAEERTRQDRVADARIAVIPDAGDEYGISDDFSQVQELLRSRVKAYNEKLDRAMLSVLARFGILHRSIRTSAGPGTAAVAVFSVTLDSFVIACRLAAFDRSLGSVNADPPQAQHDPGAFAALSARDRAEVRELEKTLGVLECNLMQDAERQEWVDARNNAIQLRTAATYVVRACEHLKKGSRQEFEHAKTIAPSDSVVTEPKSADLPIPIGKRHRTLCDLEALVYDYDSLSVETVVLPAGGIFQPWEPRDHWRGEKVPITLGGENSEFDWGVSSWKGHFLRWDDFLSKCELAEDRVRR